MPRKIHFVCLVVVLALLSTATHLGFAQNAAAPDPPLNFGNNFFVTGDYVVAGAVGMNSHLVGGFATGTISFPDGNPGIRSTNGNTVPKGANIIAALLYWQTVEKVGATGSGQNGFFGPVINKTPQLYAISGEGLPSHGTVSFSSGGCSGGSTGKTVSTYRADVRAFLPLDVNGNVLVDKDDGVTFEVKLPSVGTNTPLTLGASLVLIYRVISPNFPLNVITIYDGAFAPSSTTTLTMSQTIQGFYQAAPSPFSRLTHIVGSGQSNKFETAYLNGTPLKSPYGSGQPAFPGYYGTWDNTTWMLPDVGLSLSNPVQENDSSATASVVPGTSQMGCVSWGAVILSTTVHDDSKDGILPVWKNATPPGYTDVATGQFVSLADVADPPETSQQDIFIQMDHVVDSNGDFSIPVAPAISLVNSAFLAKNIHLHITHGNPSVPGSDIINEQMCTDQPSASPPYYCPYVSPQVGVTAWRYGFEFIKNQGFVQNAGTWQTVDEPTCESAGNSCLRRFSIAQRNSHHYVIIGDTLGAANWTFIAGILTDSRGKPVPGAGIVSQVSSTVTFQTAYGHGLTVDDAGHTKPNGRVTVSNAITNPKLNGTFFVTGVSCPTNPDTSVPNDCSVTNKALGPYTFTIGNVGGSTANYTFKTDPYLAVFSGQATSGSGLSDVGGMGTIVTLGQWGTNATLSAYAGTLMHELGHTLGLSLHGGSYYDHVLGPNDYQPTIEPNCKSNYQSVMNYMFQTRLLGPSGVLDFSSQALSPLNETSLGPISTTDSSPIAFSTTDWYDTKQTFANVAIAASPNGATESSSVVTITTTVPHGLVTGQKVTISGVGISGYNGTFTIVSVPSSTQFTYNDVSGLAASGGGTVKKPIGTAATHHCNDTPLNINDTATYFYSGGTLGPSSEITIPWSSGTLDANFDGTAPGSGSENPVFRGYNDWGNVDLRQVGATGNSLLGPGDLLNGGPGGVFTGPGGIFTGPGGVFTGPGGVFTGPGGVFTGPGGLFGGPGGLFGGPGEINFGIAISAGTTSPTSLSASEGASPRSITLTWPEVNFPRTNDNNIYRSPDGVNFTLVGSVPGTDPGTQNTFTDNNVTCNPNGYTYFVTTVVINTTVNPPQTLESNQSSNSTVSTGQNGEKLTGCYTPPVFLSPANGSSALQGSVVQVKWTLQDASNKSGTFVGNTTANTLVAIGPINNDAVCGSPTALTPRTTIAQSGAGIGVSTGPNYVFTFNWNTTGFALGCYLLELDLDSGQPGVGGTPASAFQVQLYLSDVNESVLVTTTSLPNATEGSAYNQTLQNSGGVPTVSWTSTGTLPPGLTLNSAGQISGTPTKGGTYTFTVKATDLIGDFGTQALTLLVNAVVTTTADSGAGSLRQAILDLNSQPGPQPVGIFFNISGGGTIAPLTPLPPLATPTKLDATTQPGYTGTPLIVVNGSGAGASATGIHITAGSSTVSGLVIQNFRGDGILIDTNGGDVIQANYVGTDVTGTIPAPNGGNGIQIIAVPNNKVGAAASAMRNIISGNTGEGVRIDGTAATGNVVQGNYIGTDVSGSNAVGNSASGVYIRHASNNSLLGNVVSGNIGFAGITICGNATFCGGGDPAGIDVTSNAAGNTIQGNLVGTNAAGTAALGNHGAGVSIDGAPNTLVGGAAAGTPNRISFNGSNDVQIVSTGATGNKIQDNTIQGAGTNHDVGIAVGVDASSVLLTGNTLTRNSISGHAGLGIDLAQTGVNANSTGGANNYPVISSAQVPSGTISGTLNGPTNATFTIEFFSNTACNASGNGEGAVFLGSMSVTTDGTGNIAFAFPVAGLVAGNAITATSTDASGTTSEFSACVTAN